MRRVICRQLITNDRPLAFENVIFAEEGRVAQLPRLRGHNKGARRTHRLQERVDDGLLTPDHPTTRPHRPVGHDDVAERNTQGLQLRDQAADRGWSGRLGAPQFARIPSSQSWTTWSYRLSATPSQCPHSPASGSNSASTFGDEIAS